MISIKKNKVFSSTSLLILLAVVISLTAFIVIVQPIWLSNDDVGMSMRAHGYGGFINKTPNLLFSNSVWGEIISQIPTIGGYLGYTIAIYTALFISAIFTCLYLGQLTSQPGISALIVTLTYAFPSVTPQFTIIAGLLALAGLLAFRLYIKNKNNRLLIQAFIFFGVAYLIRWNQALLTAIIFLPLFFRSGLNFKDRKIILFLLTLSLALVSAELLNRSRYSGPDWKLFNEIKEARIRITDYGWGEKLRNNVPEQERQLSNNDLDLLSSWFFVDPQLRRAALNDMNQWKGQTLSAQALDVPAALDNWIYKRFFTGRFDELLYAGLVLLIIGPSLGSLFSFALACSAAWYFGSIGRPLPIWVAYSLAANLLIIFLIDRQKYVPRSTGANIAIHSFVAVFLSCALIILAHKLAIYNSSQHAVGAAFRRDAMQLSRKSFAAWSSYFPYEYMYPPLDRVMHSQGFRIYTIASSTLAPGSFAYHSETVPSQGLIQRLLSPEGVSFVGTLDSTMPYAGSLLEQYCKERHGGRLEYVAKKQMTILETISVRCNKHPTYTLSVN